MAVHAIVFGGIGTLVETSELQREAFNRAFDEAGLRWHWDRETYRELLGVAGGQNRIRHYASSGDGGWTLDESTVVELHARKSELFVNAMRSSRLEARPGVIRLINKARNSDVSLAIASTTSSENILALASAGGIDPDAFDVILHAGTVEHRKPHPQVYQRCLSELGIAALHAVAIEDSDSGMRSALGAGLRCIAIPGENTGSQNFDEAALLLDSLEDVESSEVLREQTFSPRLSGLDMVSFRELVAAIR